MPNNLINSTSPYLLQHAHNPVEWHEWNSESLAKAKAANKPILVSIGYSACHWCHVMERESFENSEIAEVMNKSFVCIKVDREERPDVDQVYMEAVQAMEVNGGWPLNVFLTPDQKPFYGGTYFPPKNWVSVLTQISAAWDQRRDDIDKSANEIANFLNRSDLQRFANGEKPFEVGILDTMFKTLESRFDNEYGGMDKAPKFVMPTIWMFLLRYHKITGSNEALDMVIITLREMTRAGLYDQVGGGFARYSVDAHWFAPHFEKMLYDNGQLLSLYSELYKITQDDFYKEVIEETIAWLSREMTSPEGGFYSALDADSEGVEGKFYAWTQQEAKEALGPEYEDAAAYFQMTPNGNWEHGMNILMRDVGVPSEEKVKWWKTKLMIARDRRIRPGLDDKILAGWNAMAIKGLVDSYHALGKTEYLDAAIRNITFIEDHMMIDGRIFRSYKGKVSPTEGFLEDYAFVIQAYIALYQATATESWLHKANELMTYVVDSFYDSSDQFFYYTSSASEKLIARKKEIFDNVIPASNSVMAMNLFQLGTILDNDDWKEKALTMVRQLTKTIEGEPGYLSNWGMVLALMTHGVSEIAITGQHYEEYMKKFSAQFLPFSIIQATKDQSELPLLKDKEPVHARTTVYVCYDRNCKLPVYTVEEALAQLK